MAAICPCNTEVGVIWKLEGSGSESDLEVRVFWKLE